MPFSGMVTMTTSPARAACSTVTGFAPVSLANAASVSGPRELAMDTSCPSAVSLRASVPPMLPAPMMPILMAPPSLFFLSIDECHHSLIVPGPRHRVGRERPIELRDFRLVERERRPGGVLLQIATPL